MGLVVMLARLAIDFLAFCFPAEETVKGFIRSATLKAGWEHLPTAKLQRILAYGLRSVERCDKLIATGKDQLRTNRVLPKYRQRASDQVASLQTFCEFHTGNVRQVVKVLAQRLSSGAAQFEI